MSSADAGVPESPRRFPLWASLLLLLVLAAALFGERGILRGVQANREKAALQAELQRIEGVNAELRKEIEALRSDRRYIEGVARRELGLVKEDELVYQFPAPVGPGPAPVPAPPPSSPQ
jgi:cell division protein FtsB